MTTFSTQELSREAGTPIEIYTIQQGSDTFRYTSSEDDQLIGGNTYLAISISRTIIELGPEARTRTVDVRMQTSNEFASRFIGIQPTLKSTVTIERFHRTDLTEEIRQIFKGVVQGVGFTGDGFHAIISVLPLSGAVARTIPLYTFQSPCNNVLYDAQCKVLKSSFNFIGTVSVESGDRLTLTVPGLLAATEAGFATAGHVQLVLGLDKDPRMVLLQTGDDIQLHMPFRTSVQGADVEVFAGCDHTFTVCRVKFTNGDNFQGFKDVPSRNPFQDGL